MLSSNSLYFIFFFLTFPPPKVLKYLLKFLLCQCLSPGQTSANSPVVEVPSTFTCCLQWVRWINISIFFQSITLPTSASDTNSDGRYGIYECL